MVPLHPAIIHFPLALSFVVPVLAVVCTFMIRTRNMSSKSWLIIIGLQLALVASSYVALETGEDEEDRVSQVVAKEFIHEHEEAAEIFVGVSVICLVLAVAAFFTTQKWSYYLKLTVGALGVLSCFFAYRTGQRGGELVYKHGAAAAYLSGEKLLPATKQNTPESPLSAPENESLKADDNDYGDSDEDASVDDEFTKQED